MTSPISTPGKRLPLAILGVMTAFCFVGPFGLRWIIQGGRERAWPPDRPVEWVALIGACLVVASLMGVLLVMNLRLSAQIKAARKPGAKT